jgi:hypothetical protein
MQCTTPGCWDQSSELTSIMRLVQMGAIVCNSIAVGADLQSDWRKPTAPGTLAPFEECNQFCEVRAASGSAS